MMESLGRYILTVTAAAIIVGILIGLLDKKSSHGALIRLVGGLFLTFTVIQPIAKLDFDSILAFSYADQFDGEAAAAQGKILAGKALADIIKSETEAYILDKAGLYQADVSVEVTLTQDEIPIPTFVRIQGDIAPYAKYQLQKQIEEELGISKENQLWIGQP